MKNRIQTDIHGVKATKSRANEFLALYCQGFDLPIAIENIIQDQLGIEIVPTFGNRMLDGFITGDLKQIYVNRHIFIDRPYQMRYILAREIGLFWMYDYIYMDAEYCTAVGWQDFIRSIPDEDYWQIITDINYFAGLVLVPSGLIHMDIYSGRINSDTTIVDLIERYQVEKHVLMRRIEEEKPSKYRNIIRSLEIAKSG